MKLFKRLLNNNTFIFKNGQVQQVTAQASEHDVRNIEESLLPVLIIAREHYQELEREYPVPDKKDVQNIINNEFQSLKMTHIESKDLTTSKAKIFSFDDASENFIRHQLCIYIPETLLSRFLQEQELTTVERLGQTLNLIRKGDMVFSSSGMGLYQNPQLFLASSGAGEAASTRTFAQPKYFELLLEQISCLKPSDLLMILGGQVAHMRLLQSLHLPSLGVGVLAAMIIYWAGVWGHLKWTEEFVSADYSGEDIRAVIQSKQKLEENIALYNELNSAKNNHVSGAMIWQLVISLLETDVSVGSLLYEDGELKLNLLATSVTEAIKYVREFSTVESVAVDGDIYDLQGKQSVQLIVVFKEGNN